MRALTIHQPYASLIVGWPDMDPAIRKRVENRSWETSVRGPLLIHAGKSKKSLKTWEEPLPDDLPMGAIVGVAQLAGCIDVNEIDRIPKGHRLAWLKNHQHAEGPYCFILEHPRRLLKPIPYVGEQGFFFIPDFILDGAQWEPQCVRCGRTPLEGVTAWSDDELCAACGSGL